MSSAKTIKSAFESMLFTWGEPLDVKLAADVVNINWKEAYAYFKELQTEYEQECRGIQIREINKSFQLVTNPEYSDYIERLCTPVKHKRLSQSALEVLAIVAYKQPVTKGEIEAIRGIKCDRVIEGLEKKELIREAGRSNAIGRPILYGTTEEFLKNFGFRTIKDLPEIDDIESAITAADPEIDEVAAAQISLFSDEVAAKLAEGASDANEENSETAEGNSEE